MFQLDNTCKNVQVCINEYATWSVDTSIQSGVNAIRLFSTHNLLCLKVTLGTVTVCKLIQLKGKYQIYANPFMPVEDNSL